METNFNSQLEVFHTLVSSCGEESGANICFENFGEAASRVETFLDHSNELEISDDIQQFFANCRIHR
jgi:hypothetical protein